MTRLETEARDLRGIFRFPCDRCSPSLEVKLDLNTVKTIN